MNYSLLFACLYLLTHVLGRDNFPLSVPNGRNVDFEGGSWLTLGHNVRQGNSPSGGTGLNPFGRDVLRTLNNQLPDWQAICALDSDGDGLTNGEELLDPDCVWTSSADDGLLAEGVPSHPGFAGASPETPTKIKIHAAFMTLAWLFFAPVGVLTAVVLKVKTKSVTAVNWFKIHKVCVGTAVYLTMIAYACMVYEREEFLFISTHTRLGHTVVILAIIQPLSGFYRAHINKDGSKTNIRLAWEYLHQMVGRLLLIIAVVTVFFGYEAQGFIEEGVSDFIKWLGVVLLVIGGIFCIVWAFVRTDERKQPELPTSTKKEQEPKVAKAVEKEEGQVKEEKTKVDQVTEKAKELADQAKKTVQEGAKTAEEKAKEAKKLFNEAVGKVTKS